jgi:hypothetical protein
MSDLKQQFEALNNAYLVQFQIVNETAAARMDAMRSMIINKTQYCCIVFEKSDRTLQSEQAKLDELSNQIDRLRTQLEKQ